MRRIKGTPQVSCYRNHSRFKFKTIQPFSIFRRKTKKSLPLFMGLYELHLVINLAWHSSCLLLWAYRRNFLRLEVLQSASNVAKWNCAVVITLKSLLVLFYVGLLLSTEYSEQIGRRFGKAQLTAQKSGSRRINQHFSIISLPRFLIHLLHYMTETLISWGKVPSWSP